MTSKASPEFRVIDDPMAVDAINDPLRWRIYNQVHQPKTARQLGDILGVQPSRLYYHLNLLERHGWVRVAEERRTAGNGVERLYGPGFEGGFVLSDRVMDEPGFNTHGWQIGELEESFRPFERNMDLAFERGYPADGVFGAARRFRRLSPEKTAELCDKIEALLAEYLGPTDDDRPADDAEKSPLQGFLFLCHPFVEPPSHLV